jgi:hypothetical protein
VLTAKFGIEKKNRYTVPKAIDRCLKITNGTIASLPIFHSTKTKIASRIPDKAKRAMILGDAHGRL